MPRIVDLPVKARYSRRRCSFQRSNPGRAPVLLLESLSAVRLCLRLLLQLPILHHYTSTLLLPPAAPAFDAGKAIGSSYATQVAIHHLPLLNLHSIQVWVKVCDQEMQVLRRRSMSSQLLVMDMSTHRLSDGITPRRRSDAYHGLLAWGFWQRHLRRSRPECQQAAFHVVFKISNEMEAEGISTHT